MKVLLSGASNEYSLGKFFIRGFKKLGINHIQVFNDEKYYWEDLKPIKNRYTHKLFWKIFAKKIGKKLLANLYKDKYDLIFIIKGWFYHPEVIKKIKILQPQAKVICFNPDNPFNTWHHGASNDWIRGSIPYYDVYFTCKRFLIDGIRGAGAKKVFYLPVGYDLEVHYPVEVKDENEKNYYGSDVAFIGTYDEEREWWLNHLKDYDLKIWGNDWWKANKDLQKKWMKKPAYGEEFRKICASSKIIVNIIRKQDESSHNMKTFEIPACKGLNLSTRSQEALEFFPENIAGVYFSSVDELKEKIDYLMDNEEERIRIINNAYQYLINGHHTYFDRIKTMLYNININDK